MSLPDAAGIRRPLAEATAARLDEVEVFATIGSTNTHLLTQAAPPPGRFRAAVADAQTAGRGRQSRCWISPPGAGLYLSLAYTFDRVPQQLPALTLALGVGVIDTLEGFGRGIFGLKWPNDIIARCGKLGGILTEAQSRTGAGVTVVAGVGLNIDLPRDIEPPADSAWFLPPVSLAALIDPLPQREHLAGLLIDGLVETMLQFEASGFEYFAENWRRRDWLKGRRVAVELQGREVEGIAAGVEPGGALILDGPGGRISIASGSITRVDGEGVHA